jgi:predicted permease
MQEQIQRQARITATAKYRGFSAPAAKAPPPVEMTFFSVVLRQAERGLYQCGDGGFMREFFRRVWYLLNRRRLDEELQAEMEFHREMAGSARRRSFGNVLRLREEAREAWGWTWLDRLVQDLSYAARTLRQSPGFTVTAVLVLAVGIGLNVTAFSLFNMLALKMIPVHDPATIVRLERRSPDASMNTMPYATMMFYRDHAKTLSAVMATMGGRVAVDTDPELVGADFVSANYFKELGEPAAYGRLFDPVREEATDAAPVVVLSYGFWQRRFGADPSVIGRTVHLNGKVATVIGVTSYGFATLGDSHPDVWLPILQVPFFVDGSTALTDTSFGGSAGEMWGRLAPGATAKMAEQELLMLTNEWRKRHPKDVWDKEYVRSDPGGHLQVLQPDIYWAIAMMGTLALLILAVACANLGGLLLARGVAREHEIGIRMALGASRGRVFRQMFTESLLLSLMGSVAGLALGYLVLRIVLMKTDAPVWMSTAPDWRVVLFGLGMTVVASVFFGLAPAWQIAKQRQRKTVVRQILVTLQVAASCVLLIVAGLMVRATEHVLHTDPGFGYEQVIGINPGLGQHGYTPAAAQAFLDQFVSRLRTVPGVTSVGMSSMPPLQHNHIATITNNIGGHKVPIYPYSVTPEFFQTMGIPILRGRRFLPNEKNAVIVSESLARVQWPGEDPLGKLDASGTAAGEVVVGVAGSARLVALNDGDAVEFYRAAQVNDMPGMSVVVKTAGAPDDLLPMVKAIGQELDPKLLPMVWVMKKEFKRDTKTAENLAMEVSMVGVVAVLLASVGMIGLVMYAVTQRTKEIAIRLALGAGKAHVLVAVLRQFAWPVGIGLVVGAAGAAGLSQILRKVLYGISGLDALSYASAMLLLVGIIFVAALWPARRALTVDPMRALHCE